MERPGSMAGGEDGPVKGVTACLQKLDSQGENTQLDKALTNHSQSQSQPEHHQAMDDFLEQIFNVPGWPDVGATGKAPWECSSMVLDSSQNSQKLFPKSLMGSGQGMSDLSLEDPLLASRLQQQLPNENLLRPSESTRSMALQLGSEGPNASPSQLLVGIGSPGLLSVIRSPSSGSAVTTAVDKITIQSPTQSWRPPYVGLNPVPLSLGQGRVDTGRLLGKRPRDIDEAALTRPVNQGLFTNFVGGGVAIGTNNEQAGQQSTYELALAQPQPQSSPPPVVVAAPAPARPRVRARRGQATDPHSIAERQRRERIAERMKALQELVPNYNKNDKAAMLDEILDYVKFLQLQVKVLSMSRLGGAGAVGPLLADISVDASNSIQQLVRNQNGPENICRDDEGLSITEGEVAKLMNENMGSAMQYLQNKGLCLMPLSLAVTISGRSMQPANAVRSPCASNSPQPSDSKSRSKEGTA